MSTNTKLVRFYRPLGEIFTHMKETLREEPAVAFGTHIGRQINATEKVTARQFLADLDANGWELVDAYWTNFTAQGKTVPEPRPTFVFVKKGAESTYRKDNTLPAGALALLQEFATLYYGNVYVWENLVGDNPEDPASHDTVNMVAPLKYIKAGQGNEFGMNADGSYYPATAADTLPAPGTSQKEVAITADPPTADTAVSVEVEQEEGA